MIDAPRMVMSRPPSHTGADLQLGGSGGEEEVKVEVQDDLRFALSCSFTSVIDLVNLL